MLDTQKMLTISTAHITPETAKLLNELATGKTKSANNIITENIAVYTKDTYGWFIYCVNHVPYKLKDPNDKNKYKDLRNIIELAHDIDCDIICLDCDYEPLPYLPTYDW